MPLMRRSTYFKCPACGHETGDFRTQGQEPVTCPQCKTALKRRTAFMPSLLVGLALGLLIYSVGIIVFTLTQTRPVYVLAMSVLIVLLVVWPLSPWLRKHTSRWVKV